MNSSDRKPALRLDWCSPVAAKYAVENWHYSKRLPVQKLVRIGAWEDGGFIGCVLFGDGANPYAFRPYGIDQLHGAELVRVALTSHGTAVSRIVAIALRFLRRRCPALRLVVSYADTAQGHHGGIYQAGGWVYTGRGEPSDVFVVNGRRYHQQSIDCQRLRRSADRCESTLAWLKKYRDPNAVKIVEPGKHRYVMPLDDEMRTRVATLAKPYPRKMTRAVSSARDGAPVAAGGATPTTALR